MATMTATTFSEHPGSTNYDTDGDELSTTMTMNSGFSSSYRTGNLPPSRLSRHSIKIRSSSSFPNLLSLYQAPIREESNLDGTHVKPKPKKRDKEKKKKRTQHTLLKADWEDPQDKRQRQDMRQIRVNTVAREQLEKFDDYVRSMKNKVEKQREDRRKYNEIMQERLKEQQDAEKKKLRLHRGPKHVYVHDKSYLKTLPVSNYCKTIRLADELQKKGVLRSRHDVEKFWSGYANNQLSGEDIFSEQSTNSVNYPHHWIAHRKPEIKVTDNEGGSPATESASVNQRKHLPPIKRKQQVNPV